MSQIESICAVCQHQAVWSYGLESARKSIAMLSHSAPIQALRGLVPDGGIHSIGLPDSVALPGSYAHAAACLMSLTADKHSRLFCTCREWVQTYPQKAACSWSGLSLPKRPPTGLLTQAGTPWIISEKFSREGELAVPDISFQGEPSILTKPVHCEGHQLHLLFILINGVAWTTQRRMDSSCNGISTQCWPQLIFH